MPQPDGPISETNSPGLELELDVLERRRAALAERLRDVPDRDRGGVGHATFSGARRTTSRSAIATMEKKRMPSAAAMMFVAQSADGSSE